MTEPGQLNGSRPRSSPNEIATEHRITVTEMHSERHQQSLDQHHERITYLERAVQVLIWATSTLATGKSGDLAEGLLQLLHK